MGSLTSLTNHTPLPSQGIASQEGGPILNIGNQLKAFRESTTAQLKNLQSNISTLSGHVDDLSVAHATQASLAEADGASPVQSWFGRYKQYFITGGIVSLMSVPLIAGMVQIKQQLSGDNKGQDEKVDKLQKKLDEVTKQAEGTQDTSIMRYLIIGGVIVVIVAGLGFAMQGRSKGPPM